MSAEHNHFVMGFLQSIEQDDFSLMQDFHESTKLQRNGSKKLLKRIGTFMHVPSIRHLVTGAYKDYQGCRRVILPSADLQDARLADALKNRRSLSSVQQGFTTEAVDLQQLATVLQSSYGVTGYIEPRQPTDPRQPLRAIASAGALYPCEIYVCALNINGLANGLYHYDVNQHQLAELENGDIRPQLFRCLPGGSLWRNSAAMIVIGLMIERSVSKYLERGYRFAMHDAGALLQNLYLTSTAAGLTGCGVGGFYDQQLADWLRMHPHQEFPAICFALGKI
ncbi:MAG: SagB/ThcOx family dehydrogenase [Alishewanella aestuarii]